MHRIGKFQASFQECTCENIPISSIVINPGQECVYTPDQYYNPYANYQYGGNIQPAPYGNREVYYPYPVPENFRYFEEEYESLQGYKNLGDSCSSTVSASVYYNLEDDNKPKYDCRKYECDCSTKRKNLDFGYNSNCGCENLGLLRKSSDCCSCSKSIYDSNTECRCNKRKYDCDSCRNDCCISNSECEVVDCKCDCFEKPIGKCQKNKCRCGSTECRCGKSKCCEKSDSIRDGIRAIDDLLKTLLHAYDACDCM